MTNLVVLGVMGALAGVINAAVGSGSLLTLPVLMALGLPPGEAVRTNIMGMMFATVGSVTGYRREIAAERTHRIGPLLVTVLVGALLGSCLLLVAPGRALGFVVPILIGVALMLVVFQPRISRALARRRERRTPRAEEADPSALYRSPGILASMGVASVYGGFFTAAQGVLYLGILGAFTGRPMTSVNAMKNLLSLIVNVTAASVYLIAHLAFGAPIAWPAVAAIAIGSLTGGYLGSHVAKRLPEAAMRGAIVVVAVVALARQVVP